MTVFTGFAALLHNFPIRFAVVLFGPQSCEIPWCCVQLHMWHHRSSGAGTVGWLRGLMRVTCGAGPVRCLRVSDVTELSGRKGTLPARTLRGPQSFQPMNQSHPGKSAACSL